MSDFRLKTPLCFLAFLGVHFASLSASIDVILEPILRISRAVMIAQEVQRISEISELEAEVVYERPKPVDFWEGKHLELSPNSDNWISKGARGELLTPQGLMTLYLAHRTESPEWDATVRQFFERSVDADRNLPRQELEPLIDSMKALKSANIQDPLVNFVAAHCYTLLNKPKNGLPWSEKAFLNRQSVAYPPFVRFLCSWIHARSIFNANGEKEPVEFKEAFSVASEDLIEALKDKNFINQHRAMMGTPITRFAALGGVSNFRPLVKRMEEDPDIDRYFLLLVKGRYHVSEAWASRGNGWASTVKKEGWKGFREHLVLAEASLLEAWDLCPNLPYPAIELMNVVLGRGGREAGWRYVQRLLKGDYNYYPYALGRYFYVLMPRWHGSHHDMFSLGRLCAETKRYDTKIPSYVLKSFDNILDKDLKNDIPAQRQFFKKYRNELDVVEAVYRGYKTQNNPPVSDSYIGSALLDFAIVGEDAERATRLKNELGDRYQVGVGGVAMKADRLEEQLSMMSGDSGAEHATVFRLRSEGRISEALAIERKLLISSSPKMIKEIFKRWERHGDVQDDEAMLVFLLENGRREWVLQELVDHVDDPSRQEALRERLGFHPLELESCSWEADLDMIASDNIHVLYDGVSELPTPDILAVCELRALVAYQYKHEELKNSGRIQQQAFAKCLRSTNPALAIDLVLEHIHDMGEHASLYILMETWDAFMYPDILGDTQSPSLMAMARRSVESEGLAKIFSIYEYSRWHKASWRHVCYSMNQKHWLNDARTYLSALIPKGVEGLAKKGRKNNKLQTTGGILLSALACMEHQRYDEVLNLLKRLNEKNKPSEKSLYFLHRYFTTEREALAEMVYKLYDLVEDREAVKKIELLLQ